MTNHSHRWLWWWIPLMGIIGYGIYVAARACNRSTSDMPGCVLRVGSKTLEVEDLVRVCGFTPVAVFKKGHPKAPGSAVMSRTSGFNVVVSIADDLEPQARDAAQFLTHHAQAIERLQRHAAFDCMTLDFGLHDRASPDRPWPSYTLPADLVALAGKHGIELTLSFYGRAPEPNLEQRLH